jgi:hypothetical protein
MDRLSFCHIGEPYERFFSTECEAVHFIDINPNCALRTWSEKMGGGERETKTRERDVPTKTLIVRK